MTLHFLDEIYHFGINIRQWSMLRTALVRVTDDRYGYTSFICNRSLLCPFIGSDNYSHTCKNMTICKTEDDYNKLLEEVNVLLKTKIKKPQEKKGLEEHLKLFNTIIELSRGCMNKQMIYTLKKLNEFDSDEKYNKCPYHMKRYSEIMKLSFSLASRMVYRKYESC